MQFTRLRLTGFKSFVDPTELAIAPGLTGVVGPNGCGKSNLLEALRWVMGEHRASAMRGAGMEDVIFAGTASRPPRHFAEVSLAIDNAERLAPAGFNDSDLLEITRRITRDLGSAYKVNQKEVRARDVQMLFADASTGAHSPALVRQGQIAELIAARPRARRLILEEAAGISGLYARRHEAELRLSATEQNLMRVDDILGQLAQQVAMLARQVRQAQRYRELGEALRQAEGLLLWRRWHDAGALARVAAAALTARLTEAGLAERRALAAQRTREDAAAALPPLREEAAIAGALVQRLQLERESLAAQAAQAQAAIAALTDRLAQLARDREREQALNRDADDTLARLRAEEAGLAASAEGQETRLAGLAGAVAAAAGALESREAAQRGQDEDLARLSARHHALERLREDSRKTLARNEAEQTRAGAQLAEAQAALAQGEDALSRLHGVAREARGRAEAAETALAEAESARAEAQSREAEARAQRAQAEGELSALSAEVAALAGLLGRDRRAGGQVLDLLGVAPGHEKAIGAALGDDLRAPLLEAGAAGSGWAALPDYPAAPPLPEGARPLAALVRGPPALSRRLAQVGLVEAARGAALQARLAPGQRLVSLAGDLWRWDGFCAAAADAPSAAALRLAQMNRVEALKQELAAGEARSEGVRQAHEFLKARLLEAGAADRQAREARREAEQRAGEAARRLSQAEAGRNIAAGRVESLDLALARYGEETAAAQARLAEVEAQAAGLAPLAGLRAQVEAGRAALEQARADWLARRSAHDEAVREGAARARRLAAVAHELATWQERLASAGGRLAELDQRSRAAEAELQTASAVPPELAGRRAALATRLEADEARRQDALDAVAAGEGAAQRAAETEREADRQAGAAREARARAEAVAEAAGSAVAEAASRIREDTALEPVALQERLGVPAEGIAPAEALEAEVQRLRRLREGLGAVNLRAEEDARVAGAEHERLAAEKADLEAALGRLHTAIAALNREGRERLLTAFEQVNANFGALYRHLFGGGEARLQLVESDDPLEAGLEILCQPPGKKLSVLSLLSGGEQTLTALALIFAVFQANPAPICVLDEVDAPLDDANVARFCDLMDEMARQTATRFLVITHHSVTMARMDRLYGVTMGERGVSQLVSVDLTKAEALVA